MDRRLVTVAALLTALLAALVAACADPPPPRSPAELEQAAAVALCTVNAARAAERTGARLELVALERCAGPGQIDPWLRAVRKVSETIESLEALPLEAPPPPPSSSPPAPPLPQDAGEQPASATG